MNDQVYILIFGLLVIMFEIIVMIKRQRGWGRTSFRIVGLTLIITATLYLISSNIAQERIAMAIGLLGTIAGYLLGKSEKATDD